ncbi:MAG: 16S rRNA processing protein RimM [Clostridiales bacterium]|nr:16S rRNA processing protein RimM [Clostridiales bacterium]
MKKYLEIGKIINTHGIKGEVKIEPWTDDAEFLKRFKLFFIEEKPYRLLSARVHKSFLIASLEGVRDVNEAMVLKNKVIKGDREEIELEDGQFFIQDIIGAAVLDESGKELGKISEVLDLPSSNVYVVNGDREILIPAVPEFIIKTDIEAGAVLVRLIDGM